MPRLKSLITFGPFTLDTRRCILLRDQVRRLAGKDVRVLIYLIAKRGRLVSKEELLKEFWPDHLDTPGHLYSSDHDRYTNVYKAISKIRIALDDQTNAPDYLCVESGDGYRFIGIHAPEASAAHGNGSGAFEPSYSVRQAKLNDVRWAARLAKRVYHGIDVIPASQMAQWFHANPSGFSIIRSGNNGRLGNLDILPIKPEVLARFVEGQIIELDIGAEDILCPTDRAAITTLYVESFVSVVDAGAGELRANAMAAAQVLASFLAIVNRLCDPRTLKTILAIAASVNGRVMLRRLGFRIVSRAGTRKDNHDLYAISYPTLARKLTALFGNGRRDPIIMKLIETDAIEEGL